ncbi:MAG: sigma 54-interacting transcriptional regulator, partial [Planctomycetota bacterium]
MTEGKLESWDVDPRLSCDLLRSILDTMADGVYIVDMEGIIRSWNAGAERITGYLADEVIGKHCDFLKGSGCPDCRDDMMRCPLMQGETRVSRECRIVGRDARVIDILKNAKPLCDETGKPMGVVENITDITPLKEARARIELLEDRIQERASFRSFVGKHGRMPEVYHRLQLAAESDVTVLVTGESGTGKELAAQAVHEGSTRAKMPFVKVNCSALPETLLESELFGHVRGAFTGAVEDKPGRFQAADSGTLFLDEIGDVSPLIQLKLLRALQEKNFDRVGESTSTAVDV